jgi:hypothetical protein
LKFPPAIESVASLDEVVDSVCRIILIVYVSSVLPSGAIPLTLMVLIPVFKLIAEVSEIFMLLTFTSVSAPSDSTAGTAFNEITEAVVLAVKFLFDPDTSNSGVSVTPLMDNRESYATV